VDFLPQNVQQLQPMPLFLLPIPAPTNIVEPVPSSSQSQTSIVSSMGSRAVHGSENNWMCFDCIQKNITYTIDMANLEAKLQLEKLKVEHYRQREAQREAELVELVEDYERKFDKLKTILMKQFEHATKSNKN
ncbi:unnamed protein product, partial [Didymodactylos carnosus]